MTLGCRVSRPVAVPASDRKAALGRAIHAALAARHYHLPVHRELGRWRVRPEGRSLHRQCDEHRPRRAADPARRVRCCSRSSAFPATRRPGTRSRRSISPPARSAGEYRSGQWRSGSSGLPNLGGPIVTASGLVFIAAGRDDKLRAFDVRTGRELWQAPLPAGGQATPMTYVGGGRPFVVIAAGGHAMSGWAPNSATRWSRSRSRQPAPEADAAGRRAAGAARLLHGQPRP